MCQFVILTVLSVKNLIAVNDTVRYFLITILQIGRNLEQVRDLLA